MLFFGEKEYVLDKTELFADETSVELFTLADEKQTKVLIRFLVTSFYNSACFPNLESTSKSYGKTQ